MKREKSSLLFAGQLCAEVSCLKVKTWNSRLSSDLCMCTHTHLHHTQVNVESSWRTWPTPSPLHTHLHVLYTGTSTQKYKSQILALIRRKSLVSVCFWVTFSALLTFSAFGVYVYWNAGFVYRGTPPCREDEAPASTQQWVEPIPGSSMGIVREASQASF